MYKRISIRFVPALSEELNLIAKKRGVSINSLITEIAWSFVKEWKDKYKNICEN